MILLFLKTRLALARRVKRLEKRVKLLETTLKDTQCPRPAAGQPWDQCAGDCIKLGLCGCHVGYVFGVRHDEGINQ